MNQNLLAKIHQAASLIDGLGLHHEASSLHDVFIRVAKENKSLLEHKDVIESEMTLEDALNNYDSNLYRVDPKGNWDSKEWITIGEFIDSMPDEAMNAPAAIDANHIAFELPDVGFQIINLVPQSEWDQESDDDIKEANDHKSFRKELESLINSFSLENNSDTPDFILAEYLSDCLGAFDKAAKRRTEWYGDDDDNDDVTFVSDELAKTAQAADCYGKHHLADAIDLITNKYAKNHGGLDDWFKNEKWVDVRRPKKDGGYEECGRSDSSKGKKPVCTPANKAKSLSDKERKERMKQKSRKEREPGDGKKPKTTTYTDKAGGKSNIS